MSGFTDRDAATMRVIEELKRLYKTKIKPLEQLYHYDVFNSPCISDAEFDSKPQVTCGPVQCGKDDIHPLSSWTRLSEHAHRS